MHSHSTVLCAFLPAFSCFSDSFAVLNIVWWFAVLDTVSGFAGVTQRSGSLLRAQSELTMAWLDFGCTWQRSIAHRAVRVIGCVSVWVDTLDHASYSPPLSLKILGNHQRTSAAVSFTHNFCPTRSERSYYPGRPKKNAYTINITKKTAITSPQSNLLLPGRCPKALLLTGIKTFSS